MNGIIKQEKFSYAIAKAKSLKELKMLVGFGKSSGFEDKTCIKSVHLPLYLGRT